MSSAPSLTRTGVLVRGEPVPLLVGSVHYWHLDPPCWRPALESLVKMGLRWVDTYVPWGVHEQPNGEPDFGDRDRRLDVVAFLRMAGELGLSAIVRPGPHINAELTYFGIPERVIWDAACQARGPAGDPVVLPMLPRMFPVPSYASEAYLDEVSRWFQAVGPRLAPLVSPEGPIALLQIDNEGALFFRDGAFDQDYHPDAIVKYRAFLRDRYKSLDALRAAYPDVKPEQGEELRFTEVPPPKAFAAGKAEELPYYLDWVAFHEELLSQAFARFARTLADAGLGNPGGGGIPTVHNFPLAQHTTPLNAARVGRSVDLVGFDYYHRAGEADRRTIAARTSELAVRSDALDMPAFACEMGAGFPPFFPPLAEKDSAFTVLAALAYGLRGYNIYMAVERDRWIGAPVDRRGALRPFAAFWTRLSQALVDTRFFELHRAVPVRLVTPRAERRLARVLHAFGPVSGALLGVMGQGPRETCIEHDFGLGVLPAVDPHTLLTAFEHALDGRGVPFAHVGGEDCAVALRGARWIVCATSGGFSDELWQALADAAASGVRVTLGPVRRTRDGRMLPLASPPSHDAFELCEGSDPARVDDLVARAAAELELPCVACDPDGVRATIHADAAGEARVVFVLNPTPADVVARVGLGVDAGWRDVLDDATTRSVGGLLELRVRPTSIRMLARD
jgi:beta-galactosidase